tara:strand:- start:913 stop:1203 length:291 start_codon:yes stop_codon:yes gene_type:complete
MDKSKKQTKKQQAKIQSDNIEMEGFSEGVVYGGSVDMDIDQPQFSYSFGDIDNVTQLDLFSEDELRDKYPALKQAHEHYQSILEVCKTKEKEENED